MSASERYDVRRYRHDMVRIREADHREEVFSYLMLGSEGTAVIDTGLGGDGFRALVDSLTSSGPHVLQTHLHWDHVGASHLFDHVLAHRTELSLPRVGWPWQPPIERRDGDESPLPCTDRTMSCSGTLRDGDVIELGPRVLEVIHTPGHSPGSLSFLDRDASALMCGDLLYLGKMLLFVSFSDLGDFRESLRRVASLTNDIEFVYPAHGPGPITGNDVLAIRDGFEHVWHGKRPDRQGMYEGHVVDIHEFGSFAFLVPPR